MTFEEKYGYKQYSVHDPSMKPFKDALTYLGVQSPGSYWHAIRKVIVDTGHVDDESWKDMSFVDLCKLTTHGKTVVTIVIIAQMLDRGEIHL